MHHSGQEHINIAAAPGAIETVAVIGAGLSGVVSAAHLLRAGLNVTVFERAGRAGGAWDYDPRPDRDPPFPNTRPRAPDWGELEDLRAGGLSPERALSIFAPPGPVYTNMKSRGSEGIMCTSLRDWPQGTRAPIDHGDVAAYLRDIARIHKVEERTRFRTRVERVFRLEGESRWHIQSSKLITQPGSYVLEHESWEFDSVVVATGRYGAPRVPDVPGLAAWKNMFPGRVIHSKQYRTPTAYRGKTVLIIGAFISALEITNELVNNGARVYQSGRDTLVDFRSKMDHENAESVAMVAALTPAPDGRGLHTPAPQVLDDDSPIPGRAVLQDGRVLEGIHHVIISTGYLTEFPFLGPCLEQPFTAPQDADEKVVTTADGRTVHNLHEDIFYIPDPTLAFIGVSHFASTFSLYDFQAQVLAAVFAGRVRLPSEAAMKALQRRRKSRVVPGTLLNSIFLMDDLVIRRLLDWVNEDLTAAGLEPLTGPEPRWWDAFRMEREGARPLLGPLQDNYLATYMTDDD